MSACKGNCYLESSIRNNHTQDNNASDIVKEEKINSIDFLLNTLILVLQLWDTEETKKLTFIESSYSFSYHAEVFHPPCS